MAVYGCVTFLAVTSVVLNQVASPNDQFQYRMPVPGVVSLNWTSCGAWPNVGVPVKTGIGRVADALM